MSLKDRVRRKLILAGILPKLSDLGQGMIGEAIEAAGARQFGNLHKEALDNSSILDETLSLNRPYYPECQSFSLSLTARAASTKPNVQRSGRVSIATAQRPFGEEMSIYRGARNVQS